MTRLETNIAISNLRGWKIERVGDFYTLVNPAGAVLHQTRHRDRHEQFIPDWHADAQWPTLFRELPTSTTLTVTDDTTEQFQILSVCDLFESPGWFSSNDIGEVVCLMWLCYRAATMGVTYETLTDTPETTA